MRRAASSNGDASVAQLLAADADVRFLGPGRVIAVRVTAAQLREYCDAWLSSPASCKCLAHFSVFRLSAARVLAGLHVTAMGGRGLGAARPLDDRGDDGQSPAPQHGRRARDRRLPPAHRRAAHPLRRARP